MTGPSAYNTRSKRSRSSLNPPEKSKKRVKKENTTFLVQSEVAGRAMMDIYLSGTTAVAPSAPAEKPKAVLFTPAKEEEEMVPCPYTIPERSEAAWDLAKQLVAKCSKHEAISYRHHYGVVLENENGNLSIWDKLGACYFSLNNADELYAWEKKKKLFFVDHGCRAWWRPELGAKTNTHFYQALTSDRGPAITWEEAVEYATYMANESVWRHAYVEKDPEKLLSGPSIFHTTFPYRYLIQAGMLMRHLYDSPALVRSFLEYKKHINGNAAYFIASRYVLGADGEIKYQKMNFHSPWDAMVGSEPQVLKSLYNSDFRFMKDMPLAEQEFDYFSKLYLTWTGLSAVTDTLMVPGHDNGANGTKFGTLDTRKWTNVGKFLEEVLVLNGIKGKKDA
jgi:hypothetical protein